MGPRLAYLAVWAVTVGLTVGVAWLGIRSVLIAASPERTTLLSAAELRRAAPAVSSPLATVTEAPRTSPPPSPTASASPSPSPTSSPSAPPSSAKPSPSPTETWTQVPDGKGGSAYRRTFRTAGGSVTFLAAPGDVRTVSVVPKSGFTQQATRYAADSVLVSFTQGQKNYRVLVRWWNGPYAEVTESVK